MLNRVRVDRTAHRPRRNDWRAAVQRLLLALTVGAAFAAMAPGVAQAATRYTGDVRYKPLIKPGKLLLSAGNTFYFTKLRWRGWGTSRAVGRGTAWTTDCKPSCAASKRVPHRGRVVLRGAKRCKGKTWYARSTVTYRAGGRTKRSGLKPFPLC